MTKKATWHFFQMLSIYFILSEVGQTFHREWGPTTWQSQAYMQGKYNKQVRLDTQVSLPARALWELEIIFHLWGGTPGHNFPHKDSF